MIEPRTRAAVGLQWFPYARILRRDRSEREITERGAGCTPTGLNGSDGGFDFHEVGFHDFVSSRFFRRLTALLSCAGVRRNERTAIVSRVAM